MKTRSFRRCPLLTSAAALGCVGALLVGCSGESDSDGDTEVTGTVVETESSSDAKAGGEGAEDTEAAGESDASDPARDADATSTDDSCGEPEVNNPLTGDTPIPVVFASHDNTDGRYFYTPGDEQPDPCVALDWVTLTGANGQEGMAPAGTAGATRATVVLFAEGEMVTEPAPILARSIESVERIDEATVQVNYAFYSDAPAAANENVPGSATFHWNGDGVEVTENSLPVELNDTAETLDLTALG
ncbi:MAG TPA: LppP/LprE family lipoprotein [Candidatus Corynebacterium avicola]|uniref:LppP/LprE family lipoprotein n=1 Tax=Candidatus Corynebacterium avicola TaxID=2838527 RepID=A0A9D1UM53_9CORY|nr:LppP/LprE family lipoprotein [Candidatus Corynebacterium avicola]